MAIYSQNVEYLYLFQILEYKKMQKKKQLPAETQELMGELFKKVVLATDPGVKNDSISDLISTMIGALKVLGVEKKYMPTLGVCRKNCKAAARRNATHDGWAIAVEMHQDIMDQVVPILLVENLIRRKGSSWNFTNGFVAPGSQGDQ